jgi:hypothetical protein
MRFTLKTNGWYFRGLYYFWSGKLIHCEYGLSERLLELYEGKKEMVAYSYNNYLFTAWPSDRIQQRERTGPLHLHVVLIL